MAFLLLFVRRQKKIPLVTQWSLYLRVTSRYGRYLKRLGRRATRCVPAVGRREKLRTEFMAAIALDVDPQLLHFIVKRPLGHLQELESFVNPAVGSPQGKTDEKPLDLIEDFMPGFLVAGLAQEILDNGSNAAKIGMIAPIEDTPLGEPNISGQALSIAL
jgi:hypothetical protein